VLFKENFELFSDCLKKVKSYFMAYKYLQFLPEGCLRIFEFLYVFTSKDGIVYGERIKAYKKQKDKA